MRPRADASQTARSFARCLMRPPRPTLRSRRFWSGSSLASPASGSTPSPSSPCSDARASGWSPSPSTPTTPHRQAHGGHHRVGGRILQRESGPGGHQRDAGVRIQRLLGFQLRPLRLQPRHGAGRGQEAPHSGTRPGCVPHRQAYLRYGRSQQRDGDHHQHPQRRGHRQPQGKRWGKTSIHAILINEAYTGTLVWGANAKDKA